MIPRPANYGFLTYPSVALVGGNRDYAHCDLFSIAFEKRRLIPFEELGFLNGKQSDSGLKTRLKT